MNCVTYGLVGYRVLAPRCSIPDCQVHHLEMCVLYFADDCRIEQYWKTSELAVQAYTEQTACFYLSLGNWYDELAVMLRLQL